MNTAFVYSNIDFICFNLTNLWKGCPQVILQRITGQTREDVNQSVISNLRQQCLLVAQSVLANHTGSGIGKFGFCQYS